MKAPLTEEQKAEKREYMRIYARAWRKTEKGKAAMRRTNNSAAKKRYQQSEEGKEVARRASAKFHQSDKGKAAAAVALVRCRGRDCTLQVTQAQAVLTGHKFKGIWMCPECWDNWRAARSRSHYAPGYAYEE